MKRIELEFVDSTNEYAKREDKGRDFLAIAARQCDGRGTRGRSFSSERGGVYLSLVRHFRRAEPREARSLMASCCVAVCKSLESFGVEPVIKWPNDVLLDGKKICGMLVENSFESGKLSRSIVGIGVNVENALPEELRGIATTLAEHCDEENLLEKFEARLFKNLKKSFSQGEYKARMPWLLCDVSVSSGGKTSVVKALDVDGDGMLVVLDGKVTRRVAQGDVTLKIGK